MQERALQLAGSWAAGGRLQVRPDVTPRRGQPRSPRPNRDERHDYELGWMAAGAGPPPGEALLTRAATESGATNTGRLDGRRFGSSTSCGAFRNPFRSQPAHAVKMCQGMSLHLA